MPLWVAFGLKHGNGSQMAIPDRHFLSVDEALQFLADREPNSLPNWEPAADVFAVEADTLRLVSDLVQAVLDGEPVPPTVTLIRKGSGTYEPPPITRADILLRALSELQILHQLMKVVLGRAEHDGQRTRLQLYQRDIEDMGYSLRLIYAEMRGETLPRVGTTGEENLGYFAVDPPTIEGTPTFARALESVVGELSIARHQIAVAQSAVSEHRSHLESVDARLAQFETTVRHMLH